MILKVIKTVSILLLTVFSINSLAIRYLTEEKAIKNAFSESCTITTKRVLFSNKQKESIEKTTKIKIKNTIYKYFEVYEENSVIGYAVVDFVKGKHRTFQIMTAFSKKLKVKDVSILTYNESHGGEVKNKYFTKQFKGKLQSDFDTSKNFDTITGATISSYAVIKGVKKASVCLNYLLKD